MAKFKFAKGQQVFTLLDPEWEWDDGLPEILVGKITKRRESPAPFCPEYEITLKNGDRYDMREEEDIFASLEELLNHVKADLSEYIEEAEEDVAECREQLKEARQELKARQQLFKDWQKECCNG